MAPDLPMRRGLRAAFAAMLGLLLAAFPAFAVELDPAAVAFLEQLSISVPGPAAVVICHGFGCDFRTEVAFTPADQRQFARLLAPGRAAPEAERKAIAAAVAWFERRVGPLAGTSGRTPRISGAAGDPREADCIDETANTTSFLLILDRLGLLHHHAVAGPESRGLHMAAVVRERKSGNRWVIDPWTHRNGELPDVMPLELWQGHYD